MSLRKDAFDHPFLPFRATNLQVTIINEAPTDYQEARRLIGDAVGGYAAGMRYLKYLEVRICLLMNCQLSGTGFAVAKCFDNIWLHAECAPRLIASYGTCSYLLVCGTVVQENKCLAR